MLTEEEILAAPEEDYMNDEQLAFFRQQLLDLRQSVEQEPIVEEDSTQLDAERAADESDRATQEEQYWIQVRMKERESNLIRDIDKSLHRIRTGDYGFCEDTGDEIGIRRLLIRPTSRFTAEAQARRELQTRQYAAA